MSPGCEAFACYHCFFLVQRRENVIRELTAIEWIEDKPQRTAMCPKCGIDSVIAHPRYPVCLEVRRTSPCFSDQCMTYPSPLVRISNSHKVVVAGLA